MKRIHKSKYFCGREISAYGLQRGYLDYRTLAAAFDAVLVNDITKLFYADLNGEYSEVEQENGYIDNYDAIETKREQIELLEETRDNSDNDEQIKYINGQIEIISEQIDELEREQDEQREIFQYYIISDSGAELLKEYTDDPVFYIPLLNCYVWGVTHFGTSWDYVLTDVKLELSEE
jgi:hypothetical protein